MKNDRGALASLVLSLVWIGALTASGQPPTRQPASPSTRALQDAALVLTAPGDAHARFDRRGAHLVIEGRALTVRLRALGRETAAPLPQSRPRMSGGEVHYARATGVTEWWRVSAGALEHGVTIEERPVGRGPLVLALAMGGELAPADVRADGAALVDASGARVGRYDGLVVTDALGARVPARMRASADGIAIVVDDESARYPLVVDPFVGAIEALLSPTGGEPGDEIGSAVALSADGTRAILGAPGDDSNRGSARVYVRSGSTWSEEAMLRASGAESSDRFGSAVALSADGSVAIIGVPRDTTAAGNNAGSARVFVRSGSTWTEQATLLASVDDTAELGHSVAISADGARAIVGAPYDGIKGTVHVFVSSGGAWSEESALTPAESDATLFGTSVALSADGTRALIGAPGDRLSGSFAYGSARVFVRSGATWTAEATLSGPTFGSSADFGTSVALSADGSRAIAGAPSTNDVRVFVRSGATWTEEAALVPADVDFADRLGTSVALSADGSRALVGAPNDDGAGRARDFGRVGGAWTEEGATTGVTSGVQYGYAVALTGDGTRGLVGSPHETTFTSLDVGRARVLIEVGAACTSDAECASGACVDGVCCGGCSDALDDCKACSSALTGRPDGICAALSEAVAPTVTCRPSAGVCDRAEVCRSTSTTCPSNTFATSVVCREASGGCDIADLCDGTGAACPADRHLPAGFVCRGTTGACDPAETCDGASAECPGDVRASAGTECRGAAGACDVPEECDGTSAACPFDMRVPFGTECRASSGACDPAETCGGLAECPPDLRAPAGTECRAATSACDAAEACDGTAADCPADLVAAAGVVCRDPAGECDLAETCDGSSGECPTDSIAGSSVVCRDTVGACDVAETCDGSSVECPTDAFAGSSVTCRDAVGACDVAETCDGSSSECPLDALAVEGTTCRASSAVCDPEETCDGVAASCPEDTSTCAATDGGTVDAGILDASPASDGGLDDAGIAMDAAVHVDVDGGSEDAALADGSVADAGGAVTVGGCSCRVGAPGSGGAAQLALFAMAALVIARRRAGERRRGSAMR